jgi:hypothetical protein
MPFFIFHWTDEIVEHLAEHGITPEDFQEVFEQNHRRCSKLRSRRSKLPACTGFTEDGRELFCVYKRINETEIEPVTAFERDRS